MSEEPVAQEITLQDRNDVVRFARHVALTADQLCGTLIQLTNQLEAQNMIPAQRETRKRVQKQLLKHRNDSRVPKTKIAELISKISEHPDADALVASLFRDIKTKDIRKLAKEAAETKVEEEKIEE